MTIKKANISLSQTGQFSKLMIDYINGESSLSKFYRYEPKIDAFKQAIEDRSKINYDRKLLVDVLKKQYTAYQLPTTNCQLLLEKNTFTVCTGHQICLFTGPLYFIYKIITTINLAEKLKQYYPEYNFVPVYWMATEDHDFEEISSIHLFGKTISWNNEKAKGPVGRLSTASLSFVIEQLKQILGESENAKELIQLFSDAYLKHNNLADATRYLVNQLFGNHGLVIVDGNDAQLKSQFTEIIKDDIQNNINFKIVNTTATELKKSGYDVQVNPREINVFQLTNNDRVRIEKSTPEVLKLKPEEYSPNVVLRPLYQQKILPNLAYIGGPGEIAYWLEYKDMFDHHKIMFPVLIPRNFVTLTDDKTNQQLEKLGFTITDIFKDIEILIREYVSKHASTELTLRTEEEKLTTIYTEISAKATTVDPTLKASVEAELQKSVNALKYIETKLIRAEKQKQETGINQIKKVKDKFLPKGALQERYENITPYYLKSGKNLIVDLKKELDPFKFEMLIFVIRENS
ncbi:MAG: bacillithiol biosynthesis cysteine-adding enzyme BshC [Bacteroidota bacterium]